MHVDAIIEGVISREGTIYVNHPQDRGGPTRYGITQATLEAWRGHPVSADDLRCLSREEATRIYRTRYVEGPGFLRVTTDAGLLSTLVDFAVHSGPRAAVLALQRAIGVTPDGVIGQATIDAVQALAPVEVQWRVLVLRAELLCRLVWRDPRQRPFFRGWLRRVLEQVPTDGH